MSIGIVIIFTLLAVCWEIDRSINRLSDYINERFCDLETKIEDKIK